MKFVLVNILFVNHFHIFLLSLKIIIILAIPVLLEGDGQGDGVFLDVFLDEGIVGGLLGIGEHDNIFVHLLGEAPYAVDVYHRITQVGGLNVVVVEFGMAFIAYLLLARGQHGKQQGEQRKACSF